MDSFDERTQRQTCQCFGEALFTSSFIHFLLRLRRKLVGGVNSHSKGAPSAFVLSPAGHEGQQGDCLK